MIKDGKTIIKYDVNEKTCKSCIHQIDGMCELLYFYALPYMHNSCCIEYTHYNELKEVK